jgi:hypothetical protein
VQPRQIRFTRDDGHGEMGCLLDGRHQCRHQVRIADNRTRTAIVQQIRELICLRLWVDHRDNSVRLQNAPERDDGFNGVVREHDHAVSALYSALDQRMRQRVGQFVQSRVGHALTLTDERNLVGETTGRFDQIVVKQ